MNPLQIVIQQTGIPEQKAMNLLTDAHIISDHCLSASDVWQFDSLRAARWIETYAIQNPTIKGTGVHQDGTKCSG